MKILFVCKHNRFRSKVAEAFFNLYNKNPRMKAESAGEKLDFNPVAKNVRKIMSEKGIVINNEMPRMLTDKLADEMDRIIVVADNVLLENANSGKLEVWNVPDCSEHEPEEIRKVVNLIELKVKDFIKRMN